VLEGGTPPPEPALVELRCEGERQPQAYTHRRVEGEGHFVGMHTLTAPPQAREAYEVGIAGTNPVKEWLRVPPWTGA
jgi:hypothetical protein